MTKICDTGNTYIFFDEIQHVKDFPDIVKSLNLKNVDLYITGSNAYMMSSEIATLLYGRYIEIQMPPLSFKEYVIATNSKENLQKAYTQHITRSSFPYTLELDSINNITESAMPGCWHCGFIFLEQYFMTCTVLGLYNLDTFFFGRFNSINTVTFFC